MLGAIATRIVRALGATPETRRYAAAQQGRLTGGWTTTNLHANQEIRHTGMVLRARARQLERDDDYFGGFLKDLETNVIGPDGIRLQSRVMSGEKPDRAVNDAVEKAFTDWGRKKHCTVTNQDDLRAVQALALRTLAIDGEFLIRLINDPVSPYGIRLQFLDVDWLDEQYNEDKLPNGNRVIMSVEVNDFDEPVAYHLTRPRWTNGAFPMQPLAPGREDRVRVDASQIIHRFVRTRIGQVRGVSWAHAAMMRLNMLGGYEEAELVSARVGASHMGLLTKNADEQEMSSAVGATENLEFEVTPGIIKEVPAGYSLQEFSPGRSGSNYQIFMKTALRGIAKSLGVSYTTLASDAESVSFSSIRDGTIRERDFWKYVQAWMAVNFMQDVFEKFLMFNFNIVPAAKLQDAMYPTWRARGFDWVDPAKDILADIMAVNAGLKSRTEVLGERGKDFEEEMALRKYEQGIIDEHGLVFNSPNSPEQLMADIEQAEAAAQAAADAAKAAPNQPNKQTNKGVKK